MSVSDYQSRYLPLVCKPSDNQPYNTNRSLDIIKSFRGNAPRHFDYSDEILVPFLSVEKSRGIIDNKNIFTCLINLFGAKLNYLFEFMSARINFIKQLIIL